jgi:hypothetical protein
MEGPESWSPAVQPLCWGYWRSTQGYILALTLP